ncbi:EAL domain-containing protein [Fusibacter sp. JL216-2]|uniref:EAL domain-containing protein n=1 Tax=Fusibacter sp. JL216-2 TaxID=3071453 RepID=UPI003D34AE98
MLDLIDAFKTENDYEKIFKQFGVLNTGLWKMDRNGDVSLYNQAFYSRLNLRFPFTTIDDWMKNVHPEDRKSFKEVLKDHTQSREVKVQSEYRLLDRSGECIWIKANGIAHYSTSGHLQAMYGCHVDITEQKLFQAKLHDIAYLDEVTGFFNYSKATLDISYAISKNKQTTMILIKVFDYMQLVSIHGVEFVDQVIEKGAHIINRILPNHYSIYRLNSSEIALTTGQTVSEYEIRETICKIQKSINKLSRSLDLSGNIRLTSSVIQFPLAGYDNSCDDVLKRAYLSLTKSIRVGTGSTVFYEAIDKSELKRTLHIENNMRKDLSQGRFSVLFQPLIVENKPADRRFEALVRWHTMEWGYISPNVFIPISEENLVILDIGDFVLEEACKFIQTYNMHYKFDVRVSVNISVKQLMQADFSDRIMKIIDAYGLTYKSFVFEVTESILIENFEYINKHLSYLKNLGFGISLDDFGTGYAALNTVVKVPLTEIKIDRSIIQQVCEDPLMHSFVESFMTLFHEHNVDVVAEGVETLEMYSILSDLKFDAYQGYYFSKPLSKELILKADNDH